MDLEEIQKHLDKVMREQNNQSLSKFQGYSPSEMNHILYSTFNQNSPISLRTLSDSDYQNIPILNQIKYLTNLISNNGEIKLTKKGYLPTKTVADLYSQKFLKDKYIELGTAKLYKETDSMTINLTRILVELAGLVKKRNGKMSLTKAGEIAISHNDRLLEKIITAFTTKFNWAYYDGYGDNKIGQLGFGFSLILLSNFGSTKRLDRFYADKYFKAFPDLIKDESQSKLFKGERRADSCYSVRTFERFLDYFGLIRIERTSKSWDADTYILKTKLFSKLIHVRPHNNPDR